MNGIAPEWSRCMQRLNVSRLVLFVCAILALFEGGPHGLDLTSTNTVSDLPNPIDLSFAAMSGDQVRF